MWYSDGVEGAVIEDLLKRFMADNPGINVILDNVAYQVVQEQLPIQLQAGQGPDIARVTNLKEQARPLARPDPLPLRPRLLARPTSPTRSTGCAPTAPRRSPAS